MLGVIQLVACIISVASRTLTDDLRTIDLRNEVELGVLWKDYKEMLNKTYSASEEGLRRMTWMQNIEYIRKHNIDADRGLHSFKLGLTDYVDLMSTEYRSLLTLKYKAFNKRTDGHQKVRFPPPYGDSVYPSSVNWTALGYVTRVKNQGLCGSCYAFSATGALEGQHFKKTGRLVSLSEQNIIDCSREDLGCDGGLMTTTFTHISRQGIATEPSYPYEGRVRSCRFSQSEVGATCKGYFEVLPRYNEQALQLAVYKYGPLSVAIDAGRRSFQLYKSGIYHDPNCNNIHLNHGVLLVGYGTENGVDYWLVKNSWGTTWGERGYVKMARNRRNHCGIASSASGPLV